MRDLTFFKEYKNTKDKKEIQKFAAKLLVVVIVITIVLYAGLNFMTIRSLNNEISEMQDIINKPSNQDKLKELRLRMSDISKIKSEITNIAALEQRIGATEVVDEKLLVSIFSRVPKGLSLESFSVTNRVIELNGVGETKELISEFEHSIEDIEDFNYVFISRITPEEKIYRFNMTASIPEVEEPVEGETTEEDTAEEESNEESQEDDVDVTPAEDTTSAEETAPEEDGGDVDAE